MNTSNRKLQSSPIIIKKLRKQSFLIYTKLILILRLVHRNEPKIYCFSNSHRLPQNLKNAQFSVVKAKRQILYLEDLVLDLALTFPPLPRPDMLEYTTIEQKDLKLIFQLKSQIKLKTINFHYNTIYSFR